MIPLKSPPCTTTNEAPVIVEVSDTRKILLINVKKVIG
ncbi:hypothetical protein Bsph_0118 [Lysinibacillus sphaericus C3-41]|uniref:Uncharacterized protein n=1 Tax=Lysinibacillus sphaericus (strain C3-41) TaxID=444177 RepID=B1HT01_LYSSC|nr:hypothetical protein Bsph_0118 [Lysinibacillus sphaericus C3-41]